MEKSNHWDPFEGQIAAHQDELIVKEAPPEFEKKWFIVAFAVFAICIVAGIIIDENVVSMLGVLGAIGTGVYMGIKMPNAEGGYSGAAQKIRDQGFYHKIGFAKNWSFRLPVAHRAARLEKTNGRSASCSSA